MSKKETKETLEQPQDRKLQSFIKSQYPLLFAGVLVLCGGVAVGYNVGHKQGLTVVGFDADAQDLAEIVKKQKQSLDSVSVALNATSQERDVAIENAKELNEALKNAQQDQQQAEALSATYRNKLRERGGLSLTIQNLAIKPLPSNAFEYVLDLVHVSPNSRRATGRLQIRLIQGDEILTVPLEVERFNFTDYERLTGRWTMPKGFTPQYIEVHLDGSSEPVIQRFAWQRGKQDINVPAFISEVPQTEANAN